MDKNENPYYDDDTGDVSQKPNSDDPIVDKIWREFKKSNIWFDHENAFKFLVNQEVVTFDDDYWNLRSFYEPSHGPRKSGRVGGKHTYLPRVDLGGFIYGTYGVDCTINGAGDLEWLTRLYVEDCKWGATKWMARRLGCKPYPNTEELMKADGAWEDWMDDLRKAMDWNRFHDGDKRKDRAAGDMLSDLVAWVWDHRDEIELNSADGVTSISGVLPHNIRIRVDVDEEYPENLDHKGERLADLPPDVVLRAIKNLKPE